METPNQLVRKAKLGTILIGLIAFLGMDILIVTKTEKSLMLLFALAFLTLFCIAFGYALGAMEVRDACSNRKDLDAKT